MILEKDYLGLAFFIGKSVKYGIISNITVRSEARLKTAEARIKTAFGR